ncbi:MAG: HAD-IA family hydrolase [Alphaproteobacteria bacterium]|nr:HAD-IA family hydrolase [Alphaproteobacteria bacterium]
MPPPPTEAPPESPKESTERLRLAVFDLDGTLVDSLHIIVEAMTNACRTHGLPPLPSEQVRRIVGLPLLEAIAILLPGEETTRHGDLAQSYRTAFHDLRQGDDFEEPLYPGALAALDTLESAGFLLGIATGKSHRGLVKTLENHDLERRFVTLQTADQGPGKPAPHMLQRALAEAGADNVDSVMIGDTVFDMEMARAAGVPAIGVAWGYHESGDLLNSGAALVVEHFDDVPAAARSLLEEA